jgi:hypothetical protein
MASVRNGLKWLLSGLALSALAVASLFLALVWHEGSDGGREFILVFYWPVLTVLACLMGAWALVLVGRRDLVRHLLWLAFASYVCLWIIDYIGTPMPLLIWILATLNVVAAYAAWDAILSVPAVDPASNRRLPQREAD